MDKSKFKLLRTERIEKSITDQLNDEYLLEFIDGLPEDMEIEQIDEATVDKLRREIERGFPRTRRRQHIVHEVKILKHTLTPYVGSRNLLVEAVANSLRSGGNTYNPEILFDSVRYEQADSPNNVSFVATDGNTYHIVPLTFSNDNARVRCTCLDFFYRFAYYNSKSGDLYGQPPPPYHPKRYAGKTKLGRLWSRIRGKTLPPNRIGPPANPMGVIGFCKHLIKLTEELERNKIMTRGTTAAIKQPPPPQPEQPPQEQQPETPAEAPPEPEAPTGEEEQT